MQRSNFAIVSLILLTIFGISRASTCLENLFPIYAGGSGQEFVNCIAYDKLNEYIIIGGNTTSDDFAPYDVDSTQSSGFLYALDL